MKQLKTLAILALTMCFSANLSAYDAEIQARHDSILALITGAPSYEAQSVKSITAFGAKGNGEKDCKPAFDKAMKAAARLKNGLHLVVPAGEWFVKGPIHLVSNLTLELQEGAHLKFSPEPTDYLPAVQTSWEGSFCQNISPLIYGFKLENVVIMGRGTIDGNCAETFPKWRADQKPGQSALRGQDHQEVPVEERNYDVEQKLRPHLVQLFGCRNVTLEDVFITNSPFWCVHLLKCENVICRGLRYDAKLVNNDGIDPEMTRNLLIEETEFNNGDDNVAVKAGRDNDGWKNCSATGDPLYEPQPSENIIIRNCRFKGLHGLVIGSEMSAGVCNVFCQFDEVEDLFYITSMYAGEGADDNHFTSIHDIHVKDVHANKARNAGIVLQGTAAKPIYNVSFENVTVDELKVGFSSMNTDDIILRNCNLGGTIDGAPSQVTKHDGLFDKDVKK